MLAGEGQESGPNTFVLFISGPLNYAKKYSLQDRRRPENGYWDFAWRCMLLYYATGRDDLLDNVAPEKLGDGFDTWYTWFEENRPYLRAESTEPRWRLDSEAKARQGKYQAFDRFALPPLKLPESPFPDWSDDDIARLPPRSSILWYPNPSRVGQAPRA